MCHERLYLFHMKVNYKIHPHSICMNNLLWHLILPPVSNYSTLKYRVCYSPDIKMLKCMYELSLA